MNDATPNATTTTTTTTTTTKGERSRPNTPANAPASMLWALYSQAPFPHEVVPFPVPEGFLAREALDSVAIVPLSVEDRMLCQAEADDYAKKYVLKNPPRDGEVNRAYESIYDMDVTVRVLWRACRDPNDPTLARKAFPGAKAMRLAMTPDQVSILSLHYVRVERLLSPIRDLGSNEEMDAFVQKLREGGKQFPLDLISSEGLRALVWRLVSLPATSGSPSSSPGSPPDSSGEAPAPSDLSGEAPREALVEEESSSEKSPPEDAPKLVLG